jgi:hypothetical protein
MTINRWTFFSGVFLLPLFSATDAAAQNCPWWDPFETIKTGDTTGIGDITYSGVNVQTNSGGSLSSNVQVVLEFWGGTYNTGGANQGQAVTIENNLASMFADSRFWSRYSQYGVTAGSLVATSNAVPELYDTVIDDGYIQGLLTNQLDNGYWWGKNTIYLIFLPPDITSPANPGAGYHSNVWVSSFGTAVPYAVVQQGTDSQNSQTAAHEVMEAATDPFNTGWFDPNPPAGSAHPGNSHLEIGDLCNAMAMSVNGVSWQQSWLQDQCRCELAMTPAVFRSGSPNASWLFRNSNTTGTADFTASWAISTDVPFVGDWGGTGVDNIGVARNTGGSWVWFLKNPTGGNDISFAFPPGSPVAGDIPIVGDWDHDGKTTVGVVRPNNGNWQWLLTNDDANVNENFNYGSQALGDVPIAGDWNKDGWFNAGVARPDNGSWRWLLTNEVNPPYNTDFNFLYGSTTLSDRPIAGDWKGDGRTTIGVTRPTNGTWLWLLRNSNSAGPQVDVQFSYGSTTDIPLTGRWSFF